MMGLDILDELLEAVMLWMWMMWCYCLCPECSHIPYSVLLSTGALLSMVKTSALNRESVLTWDKAYVCVLISCHLRWRAGYVVAAGSHLSIVHYVQILILDIKLGELYFHVATSQVCFAGYCRLLVTRMRGLQ
jgi:hypothetical protein